MPATTPPTRPALRARYEGRRARGDRGGGRGSSPRGGYKETSIADLSEATGLAAGGIYHYIGSKENLLIAICDDLLAPLLDEAREIVAADDAAEAQLRALLRAWLAQIETHHAHMLVFAQERHLIEREPQWRAVRRQRKQFEGLLDEILAAARPTARWPSTTAASPSSPCSGWSTTPRPGCAPTAASPPRRSPTATAT